MSVTAKLLGARRGDGIWKLRIQYTDGSDVRVFDRKMNGITDDDLKNYIRAGADRLNKVKNVGSDYTKHIGKEINIEVIPVVIPDPTAEEIAQDKWLKEWTKLDKMIHLVDNGIIEKDDSRLIAQQAKVKADWLDSYLGAI